MVVEVVAVGVLQVGTVRGDALDVRAQLRPAGETVLAGDHELRVGQHGHVARVRVPLLQTLRRGGIACAHVTQQLLRAALELLQAGRSGKPRTHDVLHSRMPGVRGVGQEGR